MAAQAAGCMTEQIAYADGASYVPDAGLLTLVYASEAGEKERHKFIIHSVKMLQTTLSRVIIISVRHC